MAIKSRIQSILSGITRFGSASSYAQFDENGQFSLNGNATQWEDLRVDGLEAIKGATAPTDETGYRGSGSMMMRSFSHTQPDEVFFTIQLPHAWKVGSDLHPHVHFSPEVSGSNGNQVSFVLTYYASAINNQFPDVSSSVLMTGSFTGNKQWYHLLATEVSDLSGSNLGISSILHCRLHRDNTGACNLQGKVVLEYFDLHYEISSLGSNREYIK